MLGTYIEIHIHDCVVQVTLCYLVFVGLADLVIRGILIGLRAWEAASEAWQPRVANNFGQLWLYSFLSHRRAPARDYWHPFILGFFELSAYPYFIATGDLKPIGGWLLFKTVVQWKDWAESRSHYQRFLIGNALVIAASVGLAQLLHIQSC